MIELVTVMAIIAILTAIAIPNYFQYIARGHRSEARATLTQAAQWMERWRTERNNYQNPLTGNPPVLPAVLQNSPPAGNSELQHHGRDAQRRGSYTLSATPASARWRTMRAAY